MFGFESPGEILLGIEAVEKGNVRQGTVFMGNGTDNFGDTALADIVGGGEAGRLPKQADEMAFRIARNRSKQPVVQFLRKMVFNVGYNGLHNGSIHIQISLSFYHDFRGKD